MEDGQQVEGSVWYYAPNKGAPIFFAAAFLATGAVHTWQAYHYKSIKLTWLYVFCALLFAVGFIFRAIGAFDYDNVTVYIVSICLCYAAPPLYELGNYHVLGRILYFVPYHSPLHPDRVLTTFAAISLVIEVLNGIGASYVAVRTLAPEVQRTGQTLLQAALIMQLVVVALFVVLAGTFQARCRRGGIRSPKVHQPLLTLYASSALIAARCIYRTIEYFDVHTAGPTVRYEWFFYVFEAALMLANSALLNARHPRRWLPARPEVYLARDGATEVTGPGYQDDRGLLASLMDPFDLYGMIKGKKQTTRFWDEDGAGGAKEGQVQEPLVASVQAHVGV
ncbi:RTA1 like protein-domain-containing protein [Camillea tinctor]|nr:RTA1 like protein-domain-containing protein [Camillea tinctor]